MVPADDVQAPRDGELKLLANPDGNFLIRIFASTGRNEDFLTMLMVAPSRGDSNEILEAKRAVNA